MWFSLVATGRITVAATVGTATLSFFFASVRPYNTRKRTCATVNNTQRLMISGGLR